MAARVAGVGKYLPQRVLTNLDLEKMVETSDEWIRDRTGIRERRLAAEDESVASMGAAAAQMALDSAGVAGDSIDLVLCATCSGDVFPAASSLIQDAVGARHAAAFDVNAACTGFLAAYATASSFIDAGLYQRILVVGSDVLSRVVDWKDRATCVLFGDGAGAVVLEKARSEAKSAIVLRSDGSGGGLLYARGPGSSPKSILETTGFCIVMDGREVFRFAVRASEEVSRQAVSAAGLCLDDIALVIPHQANQRILAAVAKGLGLPPKRMFSNVEYYGNTSAGSIPIALCEAHEQGRLHPGDNLLLVAFGGGLAWGAAVTQWSSVGAQD